MRSVFADAQQVTRDRPSRQKLGSLDEPGSAADNGTTGEDRGECEEELVEKRRLDQAAHHCGAALRENELMALAPKGGDHIYQVDRSAIFHRDDGRSPRKSTPQLRGAKARRQDQSSL